ncbi:hypothetical protein FHS85_000083 [Rhodoligotrophos appendicifer]|uniref:COG4223 family protein n=1 Tax=Rhodoligotrophos appendicifer TaxID=987056 RepID=UPI0011808992|nr:mitofilin family membrane protein [Rhodoligotrophos appendicifer]
MTDEANDKKSEAAGRPGRQPPIIDLHAEEVRKDKTPPSDEAARASETQGDGKPMRSRPEIVEPTPHRDPTPEETAAVTQDAMSSDPLRRVTLVSIGVLLVAAGILAGILAYREFGARYFPTPQTTEMLGRMPGLEQSIRDNRNRLDTFSETIESLRTRLATAEESLTGIQQNMSALRAAVDDVQKTVQANGQAMNELRETVGSAGSGANGETDQQLQALASQFQGLSGEVAALKQAQGDASSGPDITALETRLKAVEEATSTQITQQQAQIAEQARASAAIATALDSLRQRIAGGQPYEGEIKTLQSNLQSSAELSQLEQYAKMGVPSREALAQRFTTVREQLQRAPAPAAAQGTWAALVDRLKSIVRVRPVGETDWSEVATRMAPLVDAGDIAGAVRLADMAGAAPQPPLSDWLTSAKARIDAERNLQTVTAQALGRIQSSPQSGG